MSPRYWIEFRSPARIALFAAAIALIAIFWSVLPDEVKAIAFSRVPRRVPSLPRMMFTGWVGGWFLLLFVRGEDLHVMAPFDFQGLARVIAVAMICGALAIVGFFSIAFFV
jgi:hypothetical protein